MNKKQIISLTEGMKLSASKSYKLLDYMELIEENILGNLNFLEDNTKKRVFNIINMNRTWQSLTWVYQVENINYVLNESLNFFTDSDQAVIFELIQKSNQLINESQKKVG